MKKQSIWKCMLLLLAICMVFGKQGDMSRAQAAKMNATRVILDRGDLYQLKVEGTKYRARWYSNRPDVCYVNQYGKIQGRKAGYAMITAQIGRYRFNSIVRVEQPYMSKNTVGMYTGYRTMLRVMGTTRRAVWASGNPNIVAVAQNGTIQAKRPGKAYVIARVGRRNYRCLVTVVNKPTPPVVTGDAARVLQLVNQERAAYGLPALTATQQLQAAANKRAVEISNVFAHERPDGSSCFTVLSEYNISHGFAGENIAAGYSSPEAVVQGWMESPGHRANILGSEYRKMGIGYYKNPNSPFRYYWVQLFTD